MRKIQKEIILQSINNLKNITNNKSWGLIALFCSTTNENQIKSNITYEVKANDLADILQDFFYFGDQFKETNTTASFFYRLSNKWESVVLDYFDSENANISDFAIFFYKNKLFQKPPSKKELVKDFTSALNISMSLIDKIFNTTFVDSPLLLSDDYKIKDILADFKKDLNLDNENDTLSFESPFTLSSHPSELKRAPFIQTLYSGSKIQELILLTDFNLDDYYPNFEINKISKKIFKLNQIFYGAPGTGKSHKVNELILGKENRTERIIFHPEYDYSSFVGGYKPISIDDEIKYQFVPQVFTNIYIDAWKNSNNDYYLVIEEINRGNCAEIFGDIFQLLDRNSDYTITPSKELKEYLENELAIEGKDGIVNGKMRLPQNLNILATMNTSDQSLFPMDSAFKRRWDWEYMPIVYKETNEDGKENKSYKYIVYIDSSLSFKWLDFIKSANNIIRENPNLGMDKCIGNYFINCEENAIQLAEFIHKAIFYLWNDVFKDETNTIFEENTSYEDFFPINPNGKKLVLKMLEKMDIDTADIQNNNIENSN
jgi:hypothetical protein